MASQSEAPAFLPEGISGQQHVKRCLSMGEGARTGSAGWCQGICGRRPILLPVPSTVVGKLPVDGFADSDARAPAHEKQVIDPAAEHVIATITVGAKVSLGYYGEVEIRSDLHLQPML